MKNPLKPLYLSVAAIAMLLPLTSGAQVSKETPDSLSAPDRVDTRIGELQFDDGVPSAETADKVKDTLDFTAPPMRTNSVSAEPLP